MGIKTVLFKFVGVFIGFYILLGILMFFFQGYMVYYPDDQNFEECYGFDEYEKKKIDTTRFYYKEGKDDGVIVYYHGNAGSACDRANYRHYFENIGYSVIFVEYTGYSGDDKRPSKDLIYRDVERMNSFIVENSFDTVIVYGQSLGSGAASYHAYLGEVDMLILVSPFARLSDLARERFPFYPISLLFREEYDNVYWLDDFDGKVLVFHGEDDLVIQPTHSENLFMTLTSSDKKYMIIEGRGHNDIWSSSRFRALLLEALNDMAY